MKGGVYRMLTFDFRQKIARCVLYATKPFSVPENALPLAGVKITPKS